MLYEKEGLTFKGLIKKKDFLIETQEKPGLETFWVFYPQENSFCVMSSNSKDDIDVPESDVKEIQLVLTSKQYEQYRNFLDKNVKVTGALFHSHTAHHHTQVLLTVEKIEPL